MTQGAIVLSVFIVLFSFYAGMKWNGEKRAPLFAYRVINSPFQDIVIAYNENDVRGMYSNDAEVTLLRKIPDKIENPTILWICTEK